MPILGDCNINVADYSHPYFSKFQFLCDLFNFNQLVTDYTRVTIDSATIIDLICTTY